MEEAGRLALPASDLRRRLEAAEEHHLLQEGDAITYPSRMPHWNANYGTDPVTVLFCLTPPSF